MASLLVECGSDGVGCGVRGCAGDTAGCAGCAGCVFGVVAVVVVVSLIHYSCMFTRG